MLQIPEKIKQARISAGLTEDQLAEKIGVKRSTYQYWEKKTPSVDKIKLIAKALNLSDEYFLINNDENSITAEEDNNQATEPEFVAEGKEIIKNGNLVKNPNLKHHRGHGRVINFYDVDFMAGNIEFYEDRQLTQPAYTMDIPEFSGCTAFRVYNDSMEPLIKSGTIVFGTEIFHWQEYLDYGQIYGIIRHANTPLLKYIRKSPLGKEYLLMKSENPNYDEFDLPVKEIKGIWLIHGWINKRT